MRGCSEARPYPQHAERGQALPMMVLLLALAAVVVIAVARLGTAADEAAQARTAADAAALAGAAQGVSAAGELAEANGAVLVDYVAFGNQVEVRVRVGSATAVARAERSVVWELPAAPTLGRYPADASGTVPMRHSTHETQYP